ncbi:MAG: ETC complex I subunit [Alphaproteobacteria bacterium]|nr:ETC complex I subunit [Alphaproteobacteria bacterium]
MRVRVFKPAKTATQSGRARTHQWQVEPEIVTPRAPDPIMGWASAGDTLAELRGRLRFPTLEDALAFVKAKGWDAVIEEPAERRVRPRNYLDNFRIVRPQDEERAQ